MIYAIDNEKRITPSPKKIAKCPICNSEVRAKCGKINVWHWSHLNKEDCDDWYEPESEWHKKWKEEFPMECQEFTMGKHRADIRTKNRWIIELQNSRISSEKIIEREIYYRRMIWLLNGGTLLKGIRIKQNKKTITFRWKNPSKTWWASKKEIYVDLAGNVKLLEEALKSYEFGNKKYITPIKGYGEYTFFTDYGEEITRESEWLSTIGYEDETSYKISHLKALIKLLKGKIFLIKKIYPKLPCYGWGELLSRKEFLDKFK